VTHNIERFLTIQYAFRVGLGPGEGRGPVSLLLDDDDDKSLSHLENSCSRVDIL
jgi:hypothetical protein